MRSSKMKSRSVIWVILAGLMCFSGHAKVTVLSEQLESSDMKKLLGHWKIKDSSKDAQGQWQEGQGASWHFYPILNGHAVQDDWISPGLDEVEPETGRQYGTNIRIFNPKENRWEMAWASISGKKVDTFRAQEVDNKIIMTGLYNGRSSKITFFNIQAKSFDWKLEYQQAENNVWLEVYRISATRVPSKK